MTAGPRPVASLANVTVYQVPRHAAPIDLRLDGNEGSVPPIEMIAELVAHGPDLLRNYPRTDVLEAMLAERHGVRPEQVVVTAGADEALDRACRALLTAGREAVVPVPTFEMLERYAQMSGATVREVEWLEGPYPTDAVLAAVGPDTHMIAVVSPNNPSGAVATADDLERLANAAPHAAIFVDLAYGEFTDEDLMPVALRHPNAIVFKTVSKAWGLAGLRIGYAISSARIIGWMRAVGSPYPNAGVSLLLAAQRLREGQDDMNEFVARIREERAALSDLLCTLGATPFPSQANFVTARFRDWRWVWEGLSGLGIAVRPFPGRPRLDGCIRITCPGRIESFARLTHGLRAVMSPQALLFDMDGVLADVSGSYREAIAQTAASYGVTVGSHDISAMKAAGGANNDWAVTQRLMAQRGVDVPLAQVTQRFESLYQGNPTSPGLYARERLLPARETLCRLADLVPLGVVTGRPWRDAERFLVDAGIADLIKAVVSMEDAPLKPDPAPIRCALERLGVQHAWMIGDTPDDMLAARAAGVVPIGVPAPGEEMAMACDVLGRTGAARVVSDIAELEALLP